jgi:hypothetical protein
LPSDTPQEPNHLRAGDSWTWKRCFPGYAPADGWSLLYVINSATSRFAFPQSTISADADGQTFDVSLSSAQTSEVAPGTYDFYAILTNATDSLQQTFPLETVYVAPNLAGATAPVDTRSFVKKTLDTIEAAIAGDTSPMVQEYEIHGRKVRYNDRLQLMQLRDRFRAEYRQELIAKGEYAPQRNVGITFRPTY